MAEADIEMPPVELSELDNKILDDSVKEYTDKVSLVRVISKLKEESDNSVNEFRTLVLSLADQLAVIAENVTIKQHKSYIMELITKHTKFIMDGFIIKAYDKTKGAYRKQILLKNEQFFLNNSFKDVGGTSEQDFVDKLFEFKSFWGNLKDENKEILKFYLITLCCFTDVRYVNFNKYKLLKSVNDKKFKDVFATYDPIF